MERRKQKRREKTERTGGYLTCISIAFLAGGLLGCAAALRLGRTGTDTLAAYIRQYLSAVQSGTSGTVSLPLTVWDAVRFPMITVLLGFTAFGMVGIPALLFARGFLLSFSVACFAGIFGRTGGVLAFLLLGASGAAAIPVLFLLAVQGMETGRNIWVRLRTGKQEGRIISRRSAVCLIACGAALAACVLFDWLFSPALLRAAAEML